MEAVAEVVAEVVAEAGEVEEEEAVVHTILGLIPRAIRPITRDPTRTWFTAADEIPPGARNIIRACMSGTRSITER